MGSVCEACVREIVKQLEGAVELLTEAEAALFGDGGYTNEQAELARRISAYLRPSTTIGGQ